MRYWVQVKAPAGNWVDSIGLDDLVQAKEYASALGDEARVVERTDVEVA